jgi:hypothetical protein
MVMKRGWTVRLYINGEARAESSFDSEREANQCAEECIQIFGDKQKKRIEVHIYHLDRMFSMYTSAKEADDGKD